MKQIISTCSEIIEDGYFYKRKDGKRGKWVNTFRWYTPLNVCDICGVKSTPKKIHSRSCVWGWNIPKGDFSTKSKSVLCMGCWNKIRVVVKREDEANEIKTLISKLNKRRLECQKTAK